MPSKTNLAYLYVLHKHGKVDLLQLRYFQAVARHQHVSRAAAELHVAQPALSRAIARLEAELGVPLFDRRGRRVRLNRFGAMFLARAERALGELDQGQHELRDAAGLAQGNGGRRRRDAAHAQRPGGRVPGRPPGRELPLVPVTGAGHGRPAAGRRGRPLPGLPAAAGPRAPRLRTAQRGGPGGRAALAPAGPAHPRHGRRAGRGAVRHHPPRLLAAGPHRPALRARTRPSSCARATSPTPSAA